MEQSNTPAAPGAGELYDKLMALRLQAAEFADEAADNRPLGKPVSEYEASERGKAGAYYQAAQMVKAALASAPPAPTPEAGSDLAGQGEPVAWRVGSHYSIHVYDGDRPVATFHSAEDAARAVAAVNAAPAPSRPADREEIAAIIRNHVRLEWRGHDNADINPRSVTNAADAVLERLALRDAPRDAGDGWRPMETAPKNGTRILVLRQAECDTRHVEVSAWRRDTYDRWHWSLDGGYSRSWHPAVSWRPLPAPPSPNAGDGTQDSKEDHR